MIAALLLQSPSDAIEAASDAEKLGIVGILSVALIAVSGLVLYLVRRHDALMATHLESYRQQLAELRADRDEWRALALRGAHVTEDVVGVMRKQTRGRS